jgi:SMC interacting uncharacterized protein involved in chromosome segregation
MTAVEWLVQQILKHDKSFVEFYNAEIQQANELFEQQIIDAYIEGYSSNLNAGDSEKYYNETYKK